MEAILAPSDPIRPPSALPAADEGADLVSGALSGSDEAREALLVRCRRTAYLVALQLLGSRDEAMDVAQDTLLRLMRSLDRFDTARPLTPWVTSIARNLVVDLVRRKKVRRADSLESLLAEDRIEVPDGGGSPEAHAERRELGRRLALAVRDLPPAFREVVVLRDYQDLSYEEIAGVLGVPRGTVMSRLHRARSLLRATLAPGATRRGGDA